MTTPVDGASSTKLEARGVKVHFAGVRAVDGVDLTLKRGTILGLIGPNGAGKTTFMNAISGFVKPTEGQVFLDEEDVTGFAPERLARIGVVRTFQGVATFPDLTVFQNIEVGALGTGLNRRKARARTRELLDMLELGEWERQYSSALPHGAERRVGIARALAASPEFLLLDEPAAGLNDAESRELADTIVQIRRDVGCGVLLVEHDMHVIFKVCEDLQVLDYGKSIAFGTADEVRKDKKVIEAYLGTHGAEEVAETD